MFVIFPSIFLARVFYDYTGDFIAQNFCKALQSTEIKCISCKNIEYETQWKINHTLLISSLSFPSTLFNSRLFSLLYQVHFLQQKSVCSWVFLLLPKREWYNLQILLLVFTTRAKSPLNFHCSFSMALVCHVPFFSALNFLPNISFR